MKERFATLDLLRMSRPRTATKRAINVELPVDLAEELDAVRAAMKREAPGASVSFADAVRVTLKRGLSESSR